MEKDIQDLIDYSHKFAEKMLNNGKEYYPFGATINNNGVLTGIGYKDNQSDLPKSQKIIDVLNTELKQKMNDKKIRAYGLTYDVRFQINDIGDKSDAILIDIYHQDSNVIPKYYFTYSWNKDNKLIFGDSFGINK